MKLARVLTGAAISIVAVLGISAGVAYAASTNQVVQGVTNQSVYKAGDTVNVTGVVNGDVICAGQSITIDATVNGDVICAGQTVTVDGSVLGSVRVAGQSVTIGARVAGGTSVVAQSATIDGSAVVGRDLSLVAQTASIDGRVGRDVSGTVSTATFSNTVGRNVALYTKLLTLDNGTNITGNLTYTSPQKLQRNGTTAVHGTVTYRYGQVHHAGIKFGEPIWVKLLWGAAMAVLGVVLVALFPQVYRRWTPEWGPSFWWALLTGFIAMIAVPLVIILFVISAVGVSLGILLLLLWLAAALVAVTMAAYFTGSLIIPRSHPIIIVLVGGVVLGLLELIPIIGWLIGLAVYCAGTGILLIGAKHHYHKPLYY